LITLEKLKKFNSKKPMLLVKYVEFMYLISSLNLAESVLTTCFKI
jgi:hypothetical protein